MAKLTRYSSFNKLKLSGSPVNHTTSNQLIKIPELEEFIAVLKKAALKKSIIKKKETIE